MIKGPLHLERGHALHIMNEGPHMKIEGQRSFG